MLNNNITRAISERTEQLNELLENYDKLPPDYPLYLRNDKLEEICVKVELVVSLYLKGLASIETLANTGDYMFRSDIKDSMQTLREYLKSYTSMSWNFAEILRNSRIKLEYQLKLDELDMKK